MISDCCFYLTEYSLQFSTAAVIEPYQIHPWPWVHTENLKIIPFRDICGVFFCNEQINSTLQIIRHFGSSLSRYESVVLLNFKRIAKQLLLYQGILREKSLCFEIQGLLSPAVRL